jgi:hypothetical protein
MISCQQHGPPHQIQCSIHRTPQGQKPFSGTLLASSATGHGQHLTSPTLSPTANGPIHTLCKTIKNVMSSAAEAGTGGIYLNGKEAIPICTTAFELGHPQPPTPIKTDNTTAHGILLTKSLGPKLSKAFDMRFHWMKDRIQQQQFHLFTGKKVLSIYDRLFHRTPPLRATTALSCGTSI